MVAYVAYLVPVLVAFLWPAARSVPASRPAAGASPNPENPSHVAA